jgi:3-oxoacyl-[acyl-carrier-protein] synthase II
MERRVVVTAVSAITPIGYDKETIISNLVNGVSGVATLREDDLLTKYIHSKVYGSVDYEIEYDFPRKYRKTLGPVAFYACKVAGDVLRSSGFSSEYLASGRVGVAFGSTHGSPTVQRGIYETFFRPERTDYFSINASDYLKSMAHTTAVNITRMYGITGRVIASCTACTTGSQSIGYGYEAIKFGMQDAMICGAADEYDTTTIAVFDNLLACSTAFNDTPRSTPRPFDERRDGLVVGEGAGAVLLEEYESAKRRGADILGEVIGFACSNNGGDLILPNLEGVSQTVRCGLENAKIRADQVDFISAHATATRMGDIVEAQAIHANFGSKVLVTALKSYMGHTMSACGAIETILTLYLMEKGIMVPTLNLEEVDRRCDMIRLVREVTDKKIQIAAVENFAFGGVNTILLLKSMA